MDKRHGIFWVVVLIALLFGIDGQPSMANGGNSQKNIEREMERRIKKQLFPPQLNARRPTVFEITLAWDGKLINCKKVKTSGQLLIDKSAERAITNAQPYPYLSEGRHEAKIYLVTLDPYQILSAGRSVYVAQKNMPSKGH